jgi:hypothetical protein
MGSDSGIENINVRLIDEAISVWRPIQAKKINENRYLILNQEIPEDEIWEYIPGQIVMTENVVSESEEYIRVIALG